MQEAAHPLSGLMFGSLAVVLIIVAFLLYRLLRKPENRHSMDGERERNIDEIRGEGPSDGPS